MKLVKSSKKNLEKKNLEKNSLKTFENFFNSQKDQNRNVLMIQLKEKDSFIQKEKNSDIEINQLNNFKKNKNNLINISSLSRANKKSIINNNLEFSENQEKFNKKINDNYNYNPYIDENTSLLDLHQKKVSEKELEESYMAEDFEFLRKKIKNPFFIEVNCIICRKPFSRSTNDKWKNLCLNCYLKKSGYMVNCQKCVKSIYILPRQINNDHKCQECYIKERGIKNTCANYFCKKKDYYRLPDNTKLIEFCQDCYLKKQEIILKCKDCNKEIYIYQEGTKWKSRCYHCHLK